MLWGGQEVVRPLVLDERMTALAAAISIDYDYFSQHSHGPGMMPGFLFPMPIPTPSYPDPDAAPGADAEAGTGGDTGANTAPDAGPSPAAEGAALAQLHSDGISSIVEWHRPYPIWSLLTTCECSTLPCRTLQLSRRRRCCL